MKTVKLRVIKDFEDGELKFKKGQIIDVDEKHHTVYIKMGVVKYIKDKKTKKPSKKEVKNLNKEAKRLRESQKKIKGVTETKHKATKEEFTPSEKNIVTEPILNNSDPKWLIIRETTRLPNKQELEMIVKGEEVDWLKEKSFKTVDPNQWQCKKCGGVVQSEKQPDICSVCERASSFERITKSINPDLWTLPRWKDIPVEELDMLGVYDEMIKLTKKTIIFSDEIYYKIFVLWIISSWKRDSWNTVGFLIFRGLISSGKTRALDLIRELGYRMIHTSGITFAAMLRVSHNYGAGVLIDEIDNKIDYRTESGRAMIDFLKPSYRKGSTYTVAHKDDQDETKTYKNFGLKAFAGEKGGYDAAMFSRAIDFQMEQDYPEIDDLDNVNDEFSRLRTILLNYRYKTNDPPKLKDVEGLKGRDREIFSPLIRTCEHIGIKTDDILEFIQTTTKEKQDEMKNSDEYLILLTIKNFSQGTLDDAPETISYSNISKECGWSGDSETDQKKRQKLGYIFKKKLILKTRRRNNGMVLLLNDSKNMRKLAMLYRRYHL